MRRFFKTVWFKVLAIILAVLLVLVIVAGVIGSRSSPLSAAAGTVTEPLSIGMSYIGRGFQKIGGFFTRSSTYEKRISELEGQVTTYQKELADYQETKEKLSLYENYLNIKEDHSDYEAVSATVIGKDAANSYGTFLLNKGTASGVKVNDPVICGEGQLVGVVTKAAPTYSVVSTILDPSISVSAYDIRSSENGYVSNTTALAKKGYCRLSGLDRATTVSKGGVVCTAGIGGIYPRDLVIGTVQEVKNDSYDISAYAVIKPNTDITEVNQVMVITSFDGQGISVTSGDADTENATSPDIESSTSTSSAATAAATTTRRVTTFSRTTTSATTAATTQSTSETTTSAQAGQ